MDWIFRRNRPDESERRSKDTEKVVHDSYATAYRAEQDLIAAYRKVGIAFEKRK